MTVQTSLITFSDSSLSPQTSSQNQTDNSFQSYLDQEQKRLANIFSPFNQFDFLSLFSYPDFSSSNKKVELFSDIEPPNNYSKPSYQATQQPSHPATEPPIISEQVIEFSNKPLQQMFQEILLQIGWLAPNMEANPAFLNAELKGTFLAKFDMQSLVDKIISQLEMVKDKGKSELRFGLKPESLGEILLTLTSRSGMISINIAADDEARKIMEENLNELTAALKKAKVNLENIKVSSIKEAKEHV